MTETTSVKAIPSATVLLGRDGKNGPEVFMVLRHRQIEFASGALVFPGGKVEPSDTAPDVRQHVAGENTLNDEALGFRVAAIREVFEESGFLLARKKGEKKLVRGSDQTSLFQYREPIAKGEMSLADFLKKESLILACDILTPYSHWITPEMLPKRYDTFFFIVKVPPGQKGVHDGHESVDSAWVSPEQALIDYENGKKTMMFPTKMNIAKLGEYADMDAAISAAAATKPMTVLPKITSRDGDIYLSIPAEAGYGITEASFDELRKKSKG